MLDQGGNVNDKVQFWSRKGELGRLDILGANADIVLRKVLYPVVRFVFELTWICFLGEKNQIKHYLKITLNSACCVGRG